MVVLEARDVCLPTVCHVLTTLTADICDAQRVGGRTHSTQVGAGGHWFDVGGQWVGGTHDLLRALCAELRVPLFSQYDDGSHVLELKDSAGVRNYTGNISSLNVAGIGGLAAVWQALDTLAAALDPLAPHLAPASSQLDALTVAQWLTREAVTGAARFFVEWFVRVCLAAEPHEVSLLMLLHFLRAAGGYARLADIRGGAQQDRIIGGSQLVSNRLAERLGSRVQLSARVVHVDQRMDRVRVSCADGRVFTGRFAIVTLPPPLAGRLHYTPPLPPARDQLTQRMFMGNVIKVIVLYSHPFWRTKGMSGEVISEIGPISIAYDDTSHDNAAAALVGFIAGYAAIEWAARTAAEREVAVTACYARWFGPEALKPTHYLEKYWCDEEFTRGCYLGVLPPGALTATQGALTAPCGRIHWAGTECAARWYGYMEGALDSAAREASTVSTRILSQQMIVPKL